MPGSMRRPAPAVALLAGLSLTLAGATHAKTSAASDCAPAGGMSSVKPPQFVRNIPTGETGWFASPSLVDLNGDRRLEIVAPFYSTFVFDAKGHLLGKGPRQRAASTRPASSPTSTATRSPTSSWAAMRAPSRPTTLSAASCGSSAVGRHRRAAAASAPRPVAWRRQTSTVTARARSSSRRPTRHRPGRRCSSSAPTAASGTRRVHRRPRGRATTDCRAPETTRSSTGPATTGTAHTARTWLSGTSTTIRSSRSSSPSTTTRSTSSTMTGRRCWPRHGSPTATPATPVGGSAGDSSSVGSTRPSRTTSTTATSVRGQTCGRLLGSSGPRHRRPSPTSTPTARTR